MLKPDYQKSIVNLVASVQAACGCDPNYPPLGSLVPEKLAHKKNIVLLLLDGLGYRYLSTQVQNSFLNQHCHDKLTSVFPTTTSAAISSLATGLAPMQHGITGWFMYLQQLAAVTAVLPFTSRVGGMSFTQAGIDIQDVLGLQSYYSRLNRKTVIVNQNWLIDSAYSRMLGDSCETLGYKGFDHCIQRLQQVASEDGDDKFVYAYWSEFDRLSHLHGINSVQVERHFKYLDQSLNKLVKQIDGTDTALLITADHGLIDVPPSSVIQLEDHPEMQNMLRLPLCGEPRTAYCYTRAGAQQDFIQYCSERLDRQFSVYESRQLVEENYFGTGSMHAQLFDRVGDVTLISKDSFVIKDRLAGEKEFDQRGVHGGLSEDELFVPLMYFDL